jgi:serine/threonine-protein kinase
MATVYLTSLHGPGGFQKLVVVKEMRQDLAEDPEFRRMFMEEARVAARLNHPNVVQTHEVFESGGIFGIVMEFLDGQPLNKLRTAARREVLLPLQLNIAAQALAGLEHVHEHGLVHRDVSPQNIFVTYNGDVKLLDFGIVKASDSSVQTAIGTLKGKLGYMAPEQVLGKRIDRRTDVFAMGVVLWESLTGTRIWANTPEAAIIGRLAAGSIPNVRSLAPDVPAELDAICARAMQADPEHRYGTAAEFQHALETFITRMTVQPTRRDLANLMSGLFAEQRKKLRKVIDDSAAGRAARLSSDNLAPLAALAARGSSPSIPPPGISQSGATIPPTAVTSTEARAMYGGVHGVAPQQRPFPTALVVTLAVAAALIFGIAIGAVARRPASTTSAAATSPVATPDPTGFGLTSATTDVAPAATTTLPLQAPIDGNGGGAGAATSATKIVAPASRPPVGGNGALSRPRQSTASTTSAGATSAPPASVDPAPAVVKPKPKPGEADLGY